jgi:hypothetical protein
LFTGVRLVFSVNNQKKQTEFVSAGNFLPLLWYPVNLLFLVKITSAETVISFVVEGNVPSNKVENSTEVQTSEYSSKIKHTSYRNGQMNYYHASIKAATKDLLNVPSIMFILPIQLRSKL